MIDLTPYADIAREKFPEQVFYEETEIGAFKLDGLLFKNKDIDYIYLDGPPRSPHVPGHIFAHIFKSNGTDIDKVEGDYLDWSIGFSFTNPEKFKILIEAIF